MIVCSLDASRTTIVRATASGSGSCTVTASRTLDTGLDALHGAKGAKAIAKISAALKKWPDEPVTLSLSPSAILTLPVWFPSGISTAQREQLCTIEAGYFVRNVEEWAWQTMPLRHCGEGHEGLAPALMMFYKAEPARTLRKELARQHRIAADGLHIEPIVRLSEGCGEPMAVLELEHGYASFFVSNGGMTECLKYWPASNGSEREFFAIRELGASPHPRVKVTGLAADPATVRRIASATACAIEPLGVPPERMAGDDLRGSAVSTGIIRAASTALAAFASEG